MKPFSISNLVADRIDAEELYISGRQISYELTYPVVTGAFLDASTSTLHLLRTSEAPSIEIDLSNFGGTPPASAVSIQWFEDDSGDLMVRDASFDSSGPALLLWEDDGTDSYMPLNSPLSSTTSSYQFFTEDPSGDLMPTEESATALSAGQSSSSSTPTSTPTPLSVYSTVVPLWHVDANQIQGVSSGQGISTWNDVSSNNNHLDYVVEPVNPPIFIKPGTTEINNRPYVDFTNDSSVQHSSAISHGSEFTFIWVVKYNEQASRRAFGAWDYLASNRYVQVRCGDNGTPLKNIAFIGGDGTRHDNWEGPQYIKDEFVIEVWKFASQTLTKQLHTKGAPVVVESHSYGYDLHNNPIKMALADAQGGDGSPAHMSVAESIWYDHDLSDVEIHNTLQYLNDKYDVVFPPTAPTPTPTPTPTSAP